MKNLTIITILTICFAGCVALSSCTGAEFAGGMATGVAIKMKETNDVMAEIDKNLVILEAQNDEIVEAIKDDPALLIGELNPELAQAIDDFETNLESLKAKSDSFKGKAFNWEQIALSILLGGTGVNLYKNRNPG